MKSASQIVWDACGRPVPCESATGEPVRKRGTGAKCASCGAPDSAYSLNDAISDNFTTVKNTSRGWPYGTGEVCAACVFAAKTLRLRCAGWFATESGITFFRTRRFPREPVTLRQAVIDWWREERDPFDTLLYPPPAPFVAALPLAGTQHGGENHIMRTWWPGERKVATLRRLQAKHVAIYARVAYSRECYPLQVDDQHDVIVDVALWRSLREQCLGIAESLSGYCYPTQIRNALRDLAPPRKVPVGVVADWPRLVARIRPHHRTIWWPLFVDLLRFPERKGV